MREILFRGKRVDGGEWCYGVPLVEGWSKKTYIASYEYSSLTFIQQIEIIPETVGQFTGLTDKNGKRIFEGDIIRIKGNEYNEDWKEVDYNGMVIFKDGGFCAIDGTPDDYSVRRYGLVRGVFDIEVIGNIHDNPELLTV